MNTQKQSAIARLRAILTILATFIIAEVKTQLYTIMPMPSKRLGATDMKYVIYIIVSFLIAAILFPIAMSQVTGATTTSWGAGVGPIFAQLLPILVIIAIALHIFGFV